MNGEKFIFLVEDDKDDQQLFDKALASFDSGLKYEVARNGVEALDMLSRFQQLPEVIFLDINMPMMNGLDCLRKIKAASELQQIPVFILSTSGDPVSVSVAKRLGANGYITKPFNYPDLCDCIRKALLFVFSMGNEHNSFYQHLLAS